MVPPNMVIQPASCVVAPARHTIAKAKSTIRSGPTAWSQDPQRIEAKYWFLKAINCARVALDGGPGLILKDTISMMIPTMQLSALRVGNNRVDMIYLLILVLF